MSGKTIKADFEFTPTHGYSFWAEKVCGGDKAALMDSRRSGKNAFRNELTCAALMKMKEGQTMALVSFAGVRVFKLVEVKEDGNCK